MILFKIQFLCFLLLVSLYFSLPQIDQPPLGMPSRKYLLKGLNDSDVQAYLDYQVSLAVLLGADKTAATQQLKESLEFEIQIANVRAANRLKTKTLDLLMLFK